MFSILLVDDDTQSAEPLGRYLERHGFEVSCATDGPSMRSQMASHEHDLILMALELSGTDGMALTREVRKRSPIPVIMVSARHSTLDCVMALDSGADDYLTKPFHPRELVARIQTVLRRAKPMTDRPVAACDIVVFDGWELRRNERTVVSPTGTVVALSNAEFRLLNTFLKMPRRLLSRDQLMTEARGREMDSLDRSIDLLVSRLRHKLTAVSDDLTLIKTVRGAGYMFNAQSVQGRQIGSSTA